MNLTADQAEWLQRQLESTREMAIDAITQSKVTDDVRSLSLDLAMATLILGEMGLRGLLLPR